MTTKPQPEVCPIPTCRSKIVGGVLVLIALILGLSLLCWKDKVSGDAIVSIFSLLAGAVSVLGVDAYSKGGHK